MKKLLTTLAILGFLIPSISYGAIVFDNSTSSYANPASSLTNTINVTSTANQVIFVSTMINSVTDDYNAVSCGGIAGTKINDRLQTAQNYFIALWYVLGIGSGNINCTATSTSSHYTEMILLSYAGVAQTQPNIITNSSTTNTSSINSRSISITTTADNSWAILDGIADQSLSAGGGDILRQIVTTNNPGHGIFDNNAPVHPAGNVTESINLAGTGTLATIMTSIDPFVSAPITKSACRIKAVGLCH